MTTAKTDIASLGEYYLLGRTGLKVSPLCLGTMTFGTEWGWGCDERTSRAVFDRYIEAGGNFIDTADGYTDGRSEEMIGQFIQERKNRHRIVLATKFTFNWDPGNPNAGGNSRANIHRALDRSLKRLATDYVDLYWLHAWDTVTPAEEVLCTLDAFVRAGKVRYIGLSNTPAWYLSRFQTLAEQMGLERSCALQLEYSLVERNIEQEHVPAAAHLGMGVCAWSPLASGFLTGKYTRRGKELEGRGRMQAVKDSGNPVYEKLTERNWRIVDTLVTVAEELGRSPAQVAINWIAGRPGVTSTIIGATELSQLEDNLGALEFQIPDALRTRLEEISRPATRYPNMFFEQLMQGWIHGGVPIHRGSPRSR